jgi:hypothetical protein
MKPTFASLESGPYLTNILEQDHRFIKKRIAVSLWFRSVDGALNTIAGYESMNMIRKAQVRWLAKGDIVGQMSFVKRSSASLLDPDRVYNFLRPGAAIATHPSFSLNICERTDRHELSQSESTYTRLPAVHP